MERHARSAATLAVLAMLCVFGVVVGVRAVTADFPDDPLVEPTGPVCETHRVEPGTPVKTGDVMVSVYNSGTRSGWANRALNQLERRGFAPGKTGNAPKDVKVKNVQVWADDPANPAVRLVARQFGAKTPIVKGKPQLGVGVVVVVGNGFDKLVKAPRAVKVRKPAQICSPQVLDQTA